MHRSRWNRRRVLLAGGAAGVGLALGACGRQPAAAMSVDAPATSTDPIPSEAIAITLDDPRLTFSSFAEVAERLPDRFRARRFEDGQGLGAVNPCGRLAFVTDSPYVAFDVTFLDEIDGLKIVDGGVTWDPFYADILVDGRAAGAVVGDGAIPGANPQVASLADLRATTKQIELIWPYEHAMVLTRVRLAASASVKPAPPPRRRLVCAGDSITQGYAADRPSESYPFHLARQLGMELVNMGFASRIAQASDGTRDGKLAPDVGIYMIGVNDFLLHVDQRRTPNQFGEELSGYIENWFSANPRAGSRLYLVSPLYIARPEVVGLTLQTYREMMKRICVAHTARHADHRLHYIDGSGLLPASDGLLFDGLHPLTKGHAYVARRLADAIRQT